MAYALMVSLLVTLLMGAMLLVQSLTREFTDRLYWRELARDNMESGINLVLYGGPDPVGEFSGSLFGSGLDSYRVTAEPWGMYLALAAEGTHGSETVRGWGLAGMVPKGNFKASVFLTHSNNSLSVAGNTHLSGELLVPSGKIKPTRVADREFAHKRPHFGHLGSSRGLKFPIGYAMVEATAKRLSDGFNFGFDGGDCVPSYAQLSQEFRLGEQAYVCNQYLQLDHVDLRGRLVVSAPRIWVRASSQIQNCLLFAHEIYIEEGFQGTAQFFATDTLVVGEDVRLGYPSAVVVSHPLGDGHLLVRSGATIEGCLVNDPQLAGGDRVKDSYTLLESGALLRGNVWVRENLDLRGEVVGSAGTENFRSMAMGGIRDNLLLDTRVGPPADGSWLPMPIWSRVPQEYQLIDWGEE